MTYLRKILKKLSYLFLVNASFLLPCLGSSLNKIVTEDREAYYYVGLSDGKKSLSEAMNEAYLDAVKEAVRHSFGFTQSYVENYISTLKETEIYGQMNLETSQIKLQGIAPVDEEVKKNKNGTYSVKRKIRYQKSERLMEIQRQKTVTKDKKPTQKITAGSGLLGTIKISTNPQEAIVTLIHENEKFQISGTSNAEFTIPIGQYGLYLYLPHHEDQKHKIIVSADNTELSYQMVKAKTQVDLKITPADSLIYINGIPHKERKLMLPVGETFIVRAEHPNYITEQITFTTWFKENIARQIDLRPKPARISLLSQPSSARVYNGGNFIGLTPLLNIELKAGRRYLTVEHQGYETKNELIDLDPNHNHAPLEFILVKEQIAKAEKKVREKIEIPSLHDTNFKRHKIVYRPFQVEEGESAFYHLPLEYEYSAHKFLSFGAHLNFYKGDSSDLTSSRNDPDVMDLGLNARFYFIRLDQLRLSAGAEINQRKISTLQSEAQGQGLAPLLQIDIGLIDQDKGKWGLSLNYKAHQHKGQSNVIGIGVFYEF